MNFEAIIGLEIHVQMKTKSKMFSSSPNSFSREPNTEVTPFDMAYPGTMPRVNKQAVINAIRVANALHMTKGFPNHPATPPDRQQRVRGYPR